MPRSWTYRGPSTKKEYHPLKVLRAIFGRASGPKRGGKSGGGRRRHYHPKPRYPRPRR